MSQHEEDKAEIGRVTNLVIDLFNNEGIGDREAFFVAFGVLWLMKENGHLDEAPEYIREGVDQFITTLMVKDEPTLEDSPPPEGGWN